MVAPVLLAGDGAAIPAAAAGTAGTNGEADTAIHVHVDGDHRAAMTTAAADGLREQAMGYVTLGLDGGEVIRREICRTDVRLHDTASAIASGAAAPPTPSEMDGC